MSNLLDAIDKYKFGLIAAMATYVLIFVYLQMASYQKVIHYEPFTDGSYVEIPDEEVELQPENIMVPQGFQSEVKNVTRDVNDEREKSYEHYETKSLADIEAEYKALEKEMYSESGGSVTREEIMKEMERRHEQESVQNTDKNERPANVGGDKVYAGNVMVDWSLKNRTPHQNNNWYVRNPGYTCGYGATGYVTVSIQVNQNGDVIAANYDQANSGGANPCMIDQAVKYAKMSRFSYSGAAPKTQTGRITYTFIAQ